MEVYPADELVKRAITNATPRLCFTEPRWAIVKRTFGIGSTCAKRLCKLHDFDPDEELQGTLCDACRDQLHNLVEANRLREGLKNLEQRLREGAENVQYMEITDGSPGAQIRLRIAHRIRELLEDK